MISGCFDVLAGKVIRIGHMGENANEADLCMTLAAMDKTFADLGYPLQCSMKEVFPQESRLGAFEENMTYKKSHRDHGILLFLNMLCVPAPEYTKHPNARGGYAKFFFILAVRTQNLKISCENLTILAKILQKTLINKYNKRYAKQKGVGNGQKQKRKTQFQIRSDRGIARIIPPYAVIPLLSCLAWNCIVYWGTQLLCANRPHYDFSTPF